jgi:isopenicillin N synthase-like dioxygenase
MADTEIIPVIDLGPYLAGAPGAIDRTAGELRFALTEIGFYFIVNHGVPSGQIREAFRQVARFHAQPLEKKLEIKLDQHNVGYLRMKGDTLRTSTVETVTQAKPQRSTVCGARPAERPSRRTGRSALPRRQPLAVRFAGLSRRHH